MIEQCSMHNGPSKGCLFSGFHTCEIFMPGVLYSALCPSLLICSLHATFPALQPVMVFPADLQPCAPGLSISSTSRCLSLAASQESCPLWNTSRNTTFPRSLSQIFHTLCFHTPDLNLNCCIRLSKEEDWHLLFLTKASSDF